MCAAKLRSFSGSRSCDLLLRKSANGMTVGVKVIHYLLLVKGGVNWYIKWMEHADLERTMSDEAPRAPHLLPHILVVDDDDRICGLGRQIS